MSRYKHYLDVDVLTAARQRLDEVHLLFDSVAVMFSGGKDSLVCLHLLKEYHEAHGLGPVKAVFRDEELIPSSVLDLVAYYREQPWCDLTWYAVPLKGDKFVLGITEDYVQWDPRREWVRPKPPWAVTNKDLGLPEHQVLDQYNMDGIAARGMAGKVAFITGIRASESLIRYRSVVNKLNLNYICASGVPRVQLVKPIYDWSEDDVLKYIHENELRYSPLYDAQHLAGQNLRVSTPLHSESAKRLNKWRIIDPEFFDRVLHVFPEIGVQARYWDEYDSQAQVAQYPETWRGCLHILDHFPPGSTREDARERLREFKVMSQKQPDSYTPKLLLRKLASGTVKRVIMGSRKEA